MMPAAFDLSAYMDDGIREIVRVALRASLRNPRELLFLCRQALHQRQAARLRSARDRRGQHIPPFLIASIADRCNLNCQGCYFHANGQANRQEQAAPGVGTPAGPLTTLTAGRWGELFQEAAELGVSFILLAGGEPLMNRDVLQAAARVDRIIFPVFTNGTLFDDDAIDLFARHRNLLPVFSLEGGVAETDRRRGSGVHAGVLAAMDRLSRRGVPCGASFTVTTVNYRDVSSPETVGELARHGCLAVFWVEYVPVAAGTGPLAVGDAERAFLAARQAECNARHPHVIVRSFPGDEKASGGCLAAGRGFFHINARGDAEPCPFSPFSDTSLRETGIEAALRSPLFRRLDADGRLLDEHTGGCLLFAKADDVRALVGGSGM